MTAEQKEKVNEQAKEYYEKNNEMVLEQQRDYYEKNPEKRKRSHAHAQYASDARKRGYVFELEREHFYRLYDDACFYCNDTPSCGVDRVDNTKGYSVQNTVGCCTCCNNSKGTKSYDEFEEHTRLFVEKHPTLDGSDLVRKSHQRYFNFTGQKPAQRTLDGMLVVE